MTQTQRTHRTAGAALAAALLLSTSPLAAQEVATAPSEPAAASAPIVPDEPVADTLAPTAEPTPAPVAKTAPVKAAKTTPAPSAKASAPPARSTRVSQGSAVAATSAAPVTTPVETPAAAPVAAPIAEPAPPVVETAPVAEAGNDNMLPVAGAIGAGLLALAGAGLALSRRRRHRMVENDQVAVSAAEPAVARSAPVTPRAAEPVREPSAFAWGSTAPMARAGESRIEAAYRGPTPDNPSHSLKKRLKRAAFFEQRERAVRAGRAVPVSPTAGLPQSLAERVREKANAWAQPAYRPALQPA